MSVEQQVVVTLVTLSLMLLSAGAVLHWLSGSRAIGVGHWVLGHVLFSAGAVLIAFRLQSPLPLPLTGALGNLCADGGLLLVRLGLRRFLERGALAPGWWWLLAAVVAFNAVAFDVLSAHLRIAVNTTVIAMMTSGLAWEFLRARPKDFHYRMGGGLSLFISAFLLFRAASIALDPAVVEPLSGGYLAAAAFLALIVWTRPMRW